MSEVRRVVPVQPLSFWIKLYIYGLHGIAIEVFYTAIWHLVLDGNIKLQGYSHIAAFFIYGANGVMIEKLSGFLSDRNIFILLRGLTYMLWTYAWEFTCGYVLKQFDACPWDYEPWFNNHVMGVITLEYAPFWFFGSLILETAGSRYVSRLLYTISEHEHVE